MRSKFFLFGSLCILVLGSCSSEDYVPKPRAYFRIDLPDNSYKTFKQACPFSFDLSALALAIPSQNAGQEPCWYNVNYGEFNATIHLSYKRITHDTVFAKYTEDTRNFVYKHTVKASAIEERLYANDAFKSYGLLYTLKGNTASPLQFYVTDSTQHFIRGALYFNQVPNEDSLKPVIAFLQADVARMVESMQWK